MTSWSMAMEKANAQARHAQAEQVKNQKEIEKELIYTLQDTITEIILDYTVPYTKRLEKLQELNQMIAYFN